MEGSSCIGVLRKCSVACAPLRKRRKEVIRLDELEKVPHLELWQCECGHWVQYDRLADEKHLKHDPDATHFRVVELRDIR